MKETLKIKLEDFSEALKKGEETKTRLSYNLEIVKGVERFVIENPDLRFEQILIIHLGNVDFYSESEATLEKIKQSF